MTMIFLLLMLRQMISSERRRLIIGIFTDGVMFLWGGTTFLSSGMDSGNKLAGNGMDVATGGWMFNDPDVYLAECANKHTNKCNEAGKEAGVTNKEASVVFHCLARRSWTPEFVHSTSKSPWYVGASAAPRGSPVWLLALPISAGWQ